jgi:hypothetical protein
LHRHVHHLQAEIAEPAPGVVVGQGGSRLVPPPVAWAAQHGERQAGQPSFIVTRGDEPESVALGRVPPDAVGKGRGLKLVLAVRRLAECRRVDRRGLGELTGVGDDGR